MTGAVTLRFNTQVQSDLQRMMRELTELQRQVASGKKANDLSGFGGGAARLLNTQGLRAAADAYSGSAQQMVARFGVQAAALGQVSASITELSRAVQNAISSDDGRNLGTDLTLAFSSAVSALNESWNGQPLFAGERIDAVSPVKITTLEDLSSATSDAQMFDEAKDSQTYKMLGGAELQLADKASDLGRDLLGVLRDLKAMIDGAGGDLGAPMSGANRNQLQTIVNRLKDEGDRFNIAEGKAGQLESRFSAEQTRLQDRSNLLVKELGGQTDADLAEVSLQINSLLAQYQASAKTFSDISQLSLLNFLS